MKHTTRQQEVKRLHRVRSQRGFTLLELLVVLAVLVLLVGIAWPAVGRYAGEFRIREAANDDRARLFELRSDAINAGESIEFRIEPDGHRYAIVNPTRKSATITERSESLIYRIDESAATPLTTEQIPAEWITEGGNANELSSVVWATIAVFQPDGSAKDDASFFIVDSVGRRMRLSIRGLTGSVETSQVLYEDSP